MTHMHAKTRILVNQKAVGYPAVAFQPETTSRATDQGGAIFPGATSNFTLGMHQGSMIPHLRYLSSVSASLCSFAPLVFRCSVSNIVVDVGVLQRKSPRKDSNSNQMCPLNASQTINWKNNDTSYGIISI